MKRQAVESSNLASVGYDPTSQTLEVEFNTGKVYQYANVPASVHQALMAADSHGRYFNANIRKVYIYQQIR